MALRQFTERDLEVTAAMMSDQDQMSLYPRPRTQEETHDWIRRNLRLYEDLGFGFWLMESRKGSDFLGYCGIRPLRIEGVDEIEMGWHTNKRFWHRGLAAEAAIACRDLAFGRLEISRLVATIDPDNAASRRVAEKVAMTMEKRAVLDGWPCLLYSVERDQVTP